MRIPLAALGTPAPAEGTAFRVNLFRTEGPADDAKEITWRLHISNTFHAPQPFGLPRLVSR
jgi:hypothetical protein